MTSSIVEPLREALQMLTSVGIRIVPSIPPAWAAVFPAHSAARFAALGNLHRSRTSIRTGSDR
jgi:hypothetical protein